MNMRRVLSAMLLLLLVLAVDYSSPAAQGLTPDDVLSAIATRKAEAARKGDEAYSTGHQKLPASCSQYVRSVTVPGASLPYRNGHPVQRAVRGCDEAYSTGHQKLAPCPPCMRTTMTQ
jgi:hypothetical protein